jgi:anthranilate/para-aminobenzoate synthase component I
VVRRLPGLPRDPVALGHRLAAAGGEHVALLHAATEGGWGRASWLAANPDGASHALDPVDDDDHAPIEGPLGGVPRWIGAIPYEARRSLERPGWRPDECRDPPACPRPIWRRYPAIANVSASHDEVRVIGTAAAVEQLVRGLSSETDPLVPAKLRVEAPDPDAHRARIVRARELILDGDLYQVNLARRLAIAVDVGDRDPWSIYAGLVKRAPSAFGAVLSLEEGWHALSSSPELLLTATPRAGEGGWPRFERLTTEPIKGTRPRSADAEADAALAAELDADPKERAELAMIVDVERNDVGRVCELGSVVVAHKPYVRTLPTVHHRMARVRGRVREDASRGDVLEAMLPSGSVTGAPKRRAMEVIAELEAERRGLYTGGLGYVSHDGGMCLAMAIRTAVVRGGRGHYWTGGGIVVGSDPDREVEETGWKAAQLGSPLLGST